MTKFTLQEIPTEEVPRENISLRKITAKKKVEVKKYNVERKEISKNIQQFDRKVHTKNPYDYNTISLNRQQPITPTANQMISDPLYNSVGKLLGLDTTKEWNQYYDKVYTISEYAKKKAKKGKILDYIRNLSTTVPSMGSRRIDDIYIHINLK